MPFGMENAASSCQMLINVIAKDIESCVVYLDDVIIFLMLHGVEHVLRI